MEPAESATRTGALCRRVPAAEVAHATGRPGSEQRGEDVEDVELGGDAAATRPGNGERAGAGRVVPQAAVLTVLHTLGIAVPDAARRRIQAEQDLARLERWLERASVASSIAEAIDDAN